MTNKDCRCIVYSKGELGAFVETLKVITTVGHAVVPIIDSKPQIVYTIGLWHTYRHPELVVFAIPPRQAQIILNMFAEIIKAHGRLKTDQPYADIASMPTMFRDASPAKVRPYIGGCTNFYTVQVPFMQLVWPDRQGRFPWHPLYDRHFDRLQPRLWDNIVPFRQRTIKKQTVN
jgi:hypothetical protein